MIGTFVDGTVSTIQPAVISTVCSIDFSQDNCLSVITLDK